MEGGLPAGSCTKDDSTAGKSTIGSVGFLMVSGVDPWLNPEGAVGLSHDPPPSAGHPIMPLPLDRLSDRSDASPEPAILHAWSQVHSESIPADNLRHGGKAKLEASRCVPPRADGAALFLSVTSTRVPGDSPWQRPVYLPGHALEARHLSQSPEGYVYVVSSLCTAHTRGALSTRHQSW